MRGLNRFSFWVDIPDYGWQQVCYPTRCAMDDAWTGYISNGFPVSSLKPPSA